MTEPIHFALMIFVIAPAVILGTAAFVAVATEKPTDQRKQDDER